MMIGIGIGTALARSKGGGVPWNDTKTVVILGSSDGAGRDASTYSADPAGPDYPSPATSWAGLLTAALQAVDPAWTVYNKSISGTGTASAISRFAGEVAVYEPSHIIICPHPTNDAYDFATTLANTQTLISMCRAIGARPIVRGGYLAANPTAPQYAGMLQLNRDLDALAWPRFDHMSTLDDGTGDFINPGTYETDGLHSNDLGHEVRYSAVDLAIILDGEGYGPREPAAGAWRVPTATTTGYDGIRLANMRKPLKSFTVHAKIKGSGPGGAQTKAFIDIVSASGTYLRLINPGGATVIRDAATELMNLGVDLSNNDTARFFTITYNRPTNTVNAYVDGVLAGTASIATPLDATEVVFGSRAGSGFSSFTAAGYSFTDLAVWNVPLSATEVARIAADEGMQRGGQIFRGDMSIAPAYPGNITNAARNGLTASLGFAWEAVSAF